MAEPLRVIIFTPALTSSGSGLRARLLAEGLSAAGASVVALATAQPDDWQLSEIPVVLIDSEKGWEWSLGELASRFDPQVIYGITEAGADVVCRVAKAHGCLSALDLHGLGFVEILELGADHGPRLRRVYNSLRWLARIWAADVITVAPPRLYAWLRRLTRAVVPLHGVTDVTRFTPLGPRRQLGSDPQALQVLYAGNFYRWQGVDLMLEAIVGMDAADRACFEFTFMGSIGQRAADMDRWKARLPKGLLHVLPAVEYGAVPSFCRGGDILVVPRPFMWTSHFAYPQKMVDYQAAGCAVLATNLAPHRHAAEDGKAAALCEASVEGLRQGLLRLRDPQLRRDLAHAARARAEAEYSHLVQGRWLSALFRRRLDGIGD